jgi:hypothetical protein
MSTEPYNPVVFIHIMKCGGTSVRGGLARGLLGKRTSGALFELDGQAANEATGAATNDANWEFRDALLAYTLLTASPQLALGHFRYRSRYAELVPDARFITVLREPVDRLVSLYNYRRFRPNVHWPVGMTFDEFLQAPWAAEGHNYVRTFCGRAGLDPGSDEAVTAAIENLQRFAVVGCTSRLDDFADAISAVVGKRVSFARRNTKDAWSQTVEVPEPAPESIERAREICEPDTRVYRALFGEAT